MDEAYLRLSSVVCRPSSAGLRFLDIDGSELATDGKIVVVEHQRPRYAVLVKLEFDGVNRRLLTTPGAAVEITHGDRPSFEPGERLFATGRIGGSPLVGRDYPTNDCERVENLVTLIRSVIEGHL